jgi:hypothetical protein
MYLQTNERREVLLSHLTTLRIRGVQKSAEVVLKCTMELTKSKPAANGEARPT